MLKDHLNADLQRGDSVDSHGCECPYEHDTYSLLDDEQSVDEEVQTKGLMNIDVLRHVVGEEGATGVKRWDQPDRP